MTEEKITQSILKFDITNEEKIILLVTDNYGYLHIFDITKHKKISKSKIHDCEIIQTKISKGKNLIYSLDINGILKISNFSNLSNVFVEKTLTVTNIKNSSKQTTKINQTNKKISFFDIDRKEKNLVFNRGMKIKILNFEKSTIKTVGMHSSLIGYLSFSSDSKFVVTTTEKDYFVYLWDWKSTHMNKTVPTFLLQVNSFINRVILRNVENSSGIYHAFSFNQQYIYGHLINLNTVSNEKDNSSPLIRSFQLHAIDKNLINVDFDPSSSEDFVSDRNAPLNLLVVYGNTFVTSNILIKKIKYANNFKNFVPLINEDGITLNSSNRNVDKNNSTLEQSKIVINSNFSVLNDIEMNEQKGGNSSDDKMMEAETIDNEYENNLNNHEISKSQDEKISLINLIKNSMINNDISTLEWTLDQKDNTIIETTVRKMNKNLIKLFISRLIDLFQSNLLIKSKTNFLKWIELLFKYHSVEILKMPCETLNSLKKINSIINGRTKNLERLIEINQKFEGILKVINYDPKKKTENSNIIYEPLLVYNESDSEEDKKNKIKIKEATKKRELNITSEKEFNRKRKEISEYVEDADMFVEDNAFVDDAVMDDLDMEEDEKNQKENGEEIDEDEEFEDDD